MSKQLEIMPYMQYSRCDTFRCGNLAKYSIGHRGESKATYNNLCGECLQQIINAASPEMITARPDFDDLARGAHLSDPFEDRPLYVPFSDPPDDVPIPIDTGGYAMTADDLLSVEAMDYNELRNWAKRMNIKDFSRMKTKELREAVLNAGRGEE